jgi:hypothetical protein
MNVSNRPEHASALRRIPVHCDRFKNEIGRQIFPPRTNPNKSKANIETKNLVRSSITSPARMIERNREMAQRLNGPKWFAN